MSVAGTQVATLTIQMSDGSTYAGSTPVFCSSGCGNNFGNGGSLFALTGPASPTLQLAQTLNANSVGTYKSTIEVSQNGTSIFADITVTVVAPTTGQVASIQAPTPETLTTAQGTWSFGAVQDSGSNALLLLNGANTGGGVGAAMEILNGSLYAYDAPPRCSGGCWFVWNTSTNTFSSSIAPTQTGVTPVPIYLTLSPSSPSLFDNAGSGTTVSTANVVTSQGTTYSGSLSVSPTAFFATAGSGISTSRGLTSADDGTYTETVSAITGHTVQTAMSVAVLSSAGVACDVGPPALTIPAGAQAKGFTHCAANFDFTSTANFTCTASGCGNGVTYNFATLSSWLGGCGASAPLWVNTGYNNSVQSGATPCSDFSIVPDGGTNTLHMQFTAADQAANHAGTMMTSNAGGFPAEGSEFPFTWPQGHYTEGKFRVSSATLTALPANTDYFTYFGYTSFASQAYMEWDAFDSLAGGCVNWANLGSGIVGNFFCSGGTPWSTIDPSWNFTAYHTYGELTLSDGSVNFEKCIYYDNAKYTPCYGPFVPHNTTQNNIYNGRDNWLFGLGGLFPANSPPPSATMEVWVKSITFWDCPTWQTTQCNTAVP